MVRNKNRHHLLKKEKVFVRMRVACELREKLPKRGAQPRLGRQDACVAAASSVSTPRLFLHMLRGSWGWPSAAVPPSHFVFGLGPSPWDAHLHTQDGSSVLTYTVLETPSHTSLAACPTWLNLGRWTRRPYKMKILCSAKCSVERGKSKRANYGLGGNICKLHIWPRMCK